MPPSRDDGGVERRQCRGRASSMGRRRRRRETTVSWQGIEHGADLRIWGCGMGMDRMVQCSMKTGWFEAAAGSSFSAGSLYLDLGAVGGGLGGPLLLRDSRVFKVPLDKVVSWMKEAETLFFAGGADCLAAHHCPITFIAWLGAARRSRLAFVPPDAAGDAQLALARRTRPGATRCRFEFPLRPSSFWKWVRTLPSKTVSLPASMDTDSAPEEAWFGEGAPIQPSIFREDGAPFRLRPSFFREDDPEALVFPRGRSGGGREARHAPRALCQYFASMALILSTTACLAPRKPCLLSRSFPQNSPPPPSPPPHTFACGIRRKRSRRRF